MSLTKLSPRFTGTSWSTHWQLLALHYPILGTQGGSQQFHHCPMHGDLALFPLLQSLWIPESTGQILPQESNLPSMQQATVLSLIMINQATAGQRLLHDAPFLPLHHQVKSGPRTLGSPCRLSMVVLNKFICCFTPLLFPFDYFVPVTGTGTKKLGPSGLGLQSHLHWETTK